MVVVFIWGGEVYEHRHPEHEWYECCSCRTLERPEGGCDCICHEMAGIEDDEEQ